MPRRVLLKRRKDLLKPPKTQNGPKPYRRPRELFGASQKFFWAPEILLGSRKTPLRPRSILQEIHF